MATAVQGGPLTWLCDRDEEGHRTYKVEHLVRGAVGDGPANVLQTAGLPQPGDEWNFGDDVDVWAWCRFNAVVRIHQEKKGDPNRFWTVEHTFSTKPSKRCQDTPVENPLLEPQKVSGSSVRYTKEYTHDRFDLPIKNSAHEQLRGPQVEFDDDRHQVTVEQNVANLEIELCVSMVNTLNDATLWGLPRRCVKLSEFGWEKKYYGTCSVYFTRRFVFDTNDKTFDRDLLDEGTKCLRGDWDRDPASDTYGEWVVNPVLGSNGLPEIDGSGNIVRLDPNNPANFIRHKDWHGENARCLLNGAGAPIDQGDPGTGTGTDQGDPARIHLEVYDESNFLLLGIPTNLNE